MIKNFHKVLILLCFLAFGLIIFGAYIYYVPNSKLSILFFKIGYNLTPNKKIFLTAYSPNLRDVQAGLVPDEVSYYLCEKLENTDNRNEISSIAHFYIIQSPDREYGIFRCSDEKRGKLVESIIEEMKDDSYFYSKIVLIEEIRQNKSLGKGRVQVSSNSVITQFTDDLIPLVRQKYQEWWNLNLDWNEKRKINPLANTSIKAVSCCG